MSYLKKIEFCKVYFNNHYENVFDRESFFNEDTEKYSYIDFDDNTKGFDPNFNAKITLREGVNVTYYNNVNYCRVTMNDDFKLYYFITDYEFTNSGSVITFTLEKDVWHSNLSIINTKEFQNHRQFIERMTYDGFYVYGEQFHYDNFIKDETNDAVITEELSDENDDRMLYLKILLDAEYSKRFKAYRYTENASQTDPENIKNSAPFTNPFTEIYVPFFWITKSRQINLNVGAIIGDRTNPNYERIYIPYYDIDNFSKFISEISPNVLSMSLTFNTPFNTTWGSDNLPHLPVSDTLIHYQGIIVNPDSLEDNTYVTFGFIGGYTFNEVTYNKNIQCDYRLNLNEIPNPNSYDYLDIAKTIGRYHYYPFNYKKIQLNGYKEEIIPPFESRLYTFSLKKLYGNPPFLETYYNNKEKRRVISALSNGELLINKDSLTEYLRSSANQLSTSTLWSSIASAVSAIGFAATGHLAPALGSAFAFANTIYGYQSKLQDADNARDESKIPTNNALLDLFYQDNAIITEYKMSYGDTFKKIYFLHKYGINYNDMGFPLHQRHQRFDYVKTVNCDLELPLLSDTNKLRDILNNGIRIWHCETNVADEFETFQTNYVNLPMNIVNALQTTEYEEEKEFDRRIIIEKEEN